MSRNRAKKITEKTKAKREIIDIGTKGDFVCLKASARLTGNWSLSQKTYQARRQQTKNS